LVDSERDMTRGTVADIHASNDVVAQRLEGTGVRKKAPPKRGCLGLVFRSAFETLPLHNPSAVQVLPTVLAKHSPNFWTRRSWLPDGVVAPTNTPQDRSASSGPYWTGPVITGSLLAAHGVMPRTVAGCCTDTARLVRSACGRLAETDTPCERVRDASKVRR
jgi:hypothetical protein